MPAAACNYLIVYTTISQVYSTSNLTTALKTPVPKGATLDDRRILFSTYMPDEQQLCVFPLDEEQIKAGMEKVAQEEEAAKRRAENRAARAATEEEISQAAAEAENMTVEGGLVTLSEDEDPF